MSTQLLYFDNNTALILSTNVETTSTTSSYYDITYSNAFTCNAVAVWNAANFIYEDSADITIEVTGSPSGSAVVKSDTFSASDLVGENSNLLVWDSIGMTGTHTTYRVKISTTDSFIHFDWKPVLDVYKSFDCDISAPHRQVCSDNGFYVDPKRDINVIFKGLSVADKNEIVNELYLRKTVTTLYDFGIVIKQTTDDIFKTDYYYGSLNSFEIFETPRQKFTASLNLTSR